MCPSSVVGDEEERRVVVLADREDVGGRPRPRAGRSWTIASMRSASWRVPVTGFRVMSLTEKIRTASLTASLVARTTIADT
jgi:hypothetical protein